MSIDFVGSLIDVSAVAEESVNPSKVKHQPRPGAVTMEINLAALRPAPEEKAPPKPKPILIRAIPKTEEASD
jgi:hypothetical protein